VLACSVVALPSFGDPLDRAVATTLTVKHDESLARAAARHAAQIAAGEIERDPRLALRAEGLADAQVLPFAVIGDPADGQKKILELVRAAGPFGATHFGVGRATKGPVLVVLLVRRLIDLAPLSATASTVARFAGTLRKGAAASAFLTRPTGEVATLAMPPGRRLSLVVPLDDGPGPYDVEILVETERGPEVAALWRFAVGVPPIAAAAAPVIADLPALERTLSALRSGFGSSALARDPALDRAAQSHAVATCRAGIAAHVLEPGIGPDARAKREGWAGPVAENVAIAATLGKAHANLMASPSHRANLLLADAHALGLGAVIEHDRACVVEMFGL